MLNTEDKLGLSTGSIDQVFNSIPEGIIVLNKEFEVLVWNTRIENWSKLDHNEIIGNNILTFFPRLKAPKFYDRIMDIFDGGPPVIFSPQIHKYFIPCDFPDGGKHLQHTVITPLSQNGYDYPLALINIQDVTENINHIQKIKDLNEHLKQENIERQEFAKRAEKANRSKSEFLARMSHELRTPMNAILGFTQLLLMDNQNPMADYQKDNLRQVSSAGSHLLELINEVLDLSRIETGQLGLTLDTVDIIPILDNVISISMPLAVQRDVSIERQQVSEKSIYAEVDSLRVKQVLLNLVSNAIKYNKPKGSVVVSVEKEKDGKLRLGVRDTGRGIPQDQLNRVFEPFERCGIEFELVEGAGIGLAITKKLVEMMHGTIGFESVVEEGSYFYVDLPLSEKTASPSQVSEVTDQIDSQSANKVKKKILYVDDTLANVRLVEQIVAYRSSIEIWGCPR